MDRIHYAGNSILTGSAIAHALLDYAQALSQVGASTMIEVPTINDDGTPGRSEVLIGPASQLLSNAEETDDEEIVDDKLVERMHREAEHLRQYGTPSPTAQMTQHSPESEWPDYDL